MIPMYLEFSDHSISYDTFLRDLGAHVARMLKEDAHDPLFVSKRKAHELFGRKNVERWEKAGKLQPYVRPGKTEYEMAELKLLARTEQDYLFNTKQE